MSMALPVSLGRFAAVWGAMAVAMTANGIARELLIKRALSGTAADVLSAAIGIALIAVITRVGFRPLAAPSVNEGELVAVGALLVVCTVVFETVLGRIVDHKPWPEIADHYALWHGQLWPIVLAWLALTPWVWGRWFARS
jgi:hypothetical protein